MPEAFRSDQFNLQPVDHSGLAQGWAGLGTGMGYMLKQYGKQKKDAAITNATQDATNPDGSFDINVFTRSIQESGIRMSPEDLMPFMNLSMQQKEAGNVGRLRDAQTRQLNAQAGVLEGQAGVSQITTDDPDKYRREHPELDFKVAGRNKQGQYILEQISPFNPNAGTTINMPGDPGFDPERAEATKRHEWDTMMQEEFKKQYATAKEEAKNARQQMGLYEQMRDIVPKAYSGFGGNAMKVGGRILARLGMDVEGLAESEMLEALQNQLALRIRNPESGMGLPGAASNRDVAFLKAAVPGLDKTPEGNMKLIDYNIKFLERNMVLEEEMAAYIRKKGYLDDGFWAQWNEWVEKPENDLFAGEPGFAEAQGKSTVSLPAGMTEGQETTIPGPDGVPIKGTVIIKNGRPYIKKGVEYFPIINQ